MKALVELENFEDFEVTDLDHALTIRLQVLRYMIGRRIHITSGLRRGDVGVHGLGEAVDISNNRRGDQLDSTWRHLVLKAAYAIGFRRIGDYDRHIHLDINGARDQDVTWWDKSD